MFRPAVMGYGPSTVNKQSWLVGLFGVSLTLALTASPSMLKLVPLVTIALICAFVAPTATVVTSSSAVLLVRPSTKLLDVSLGGLSITETDVLVLVAVIASWRVPRCDEGCSVQSRGGDWWPLLAWPVWMLLRALMPGVGDVIFGSPLVDLRILSAYLLIIPFWVIASRRGAEFLLKIVCYVAYAACGIAISAWALAHFGFLPRTSYALVNLSAGGALDVRPGGEILIPVLAVLLAFGRAPLLFGSRWASFSLLIGEILVSQTLSVVLAAATGILVTLLLNWKNTTLTRRVLLVSVLACLVAVGLGAVGSGGTRDADNASRFNLTERIGQASAQYRVVEAETLGKIFDDEPLALVIGTGPGSSVVFGNSAISEVKNLTHNAFNNVVLKSGVVGLLTFAGGFAVLAGRMLKGSGVIVRPLIGCFMSIAVLSVSVPFVSTVSGLAGLLGVATIGLWHVLHSQPSNRTGFIPRIHDT